jgi:hypothetical protein
MLCAALVWEVGDRNRKNAPVWDRTQRVLLMNNRAQAMTAAPDITSKSRIMFVAFVRQLTRK